MHDANLRLGPIARERSFALTHSEVVPGRYVLATVHREANVAPEPLARIVEGLGRLDEPVVFPAHPRTRAALAGLDLPLPGNVRLRPPAGYLDFAALASQARVIATDSGGVQKEAYWFGVPCVTLRERTEWVETIETGWNTLAGTDPDAIATAVERAGPGHRPSAALRRRAALRRGSHACSIRSPMTEAPVRIGLAGLGTWGPNLARNFDDLPDAELVWLCDLDAGPARALRRRATPRRGRPTASTICSRTRRSTRS